MLRLARVLGLLLSRIRHVMAGLRLLMCLVRLRLVRLRCVAARDGLVDVKVSDLVLLRYLRRMSPMQMCVAEKVAPLLLGMRLGIRLMPPEVLVHMLLYPLRGLDLRALPDAEMLVLALLRRRMAVLRDPRADVVMLLARLPLRLSGLFLRLKRGMGAYLSMLVLLL